MTGNLIEHYSGDKTLNIKGKHDETVQNDHSPSLRHLRKPVHLDLVRQRYPQCLRQGQVSDNIGQSQSVQCGMNYSLQVAA